MSADDEVRSRLEKFKRELENEFDYRAARIRREYHEKSFVVNPVQWEHLKNILKFKG